MIEATCHCGAVTLATDAPPGEVTDCNCSICRRYGVLWAYYKPAAVTISDGETHIYAWNDRSIAFHRCANCGCVTHWAAADSQTDRMGINARLMDPAVIRAVRVRHLDGDGTETYVD